MTFVMKKISQNTGFTVVELLVYIAILIMALTVVVLSVTSFGRSYNHIKAQQDLSREGALTIERLVRDIRSAQSVDFLGSTLGSHPGQLSLRIPAGGGTTIPIQYSLSGGAITLSKNGIVTGTLTESSITVNSLIFRRIQTPNSEAVKVDMTLSKNVSGSPVSASFHSTAVLRGSYAL